MSEHQVVAIDATDCIIPRSHRPDTEQSASRSMKHRPIILSLTTMHESGLRILQEATELRMASALDPATLQREVVGADGLIIRTGGVVDAALLDRGNRPQGRGPAWRRLRSDRRRRGDGPRHPGRLHPRRQHAKRSRACLCADDRPVPALSRG